MDGFGERRRATTNDETLGELSKPHHALADGRALDLVLLLVQAADGGRGGQGPFEMMDLLVLFQGVDPAVEAVAFGADQVGIP
jgi:hypothetical protein